MKTILKFENLKDTFHDSRPSKQRIEAGHLAQGVAAVAFSRCQLTEVIWDSFGLVEPIWQLSPEMELELIGWD